MKEKKSFVTSENICAYLLNKIDNYIIYDKINKRIEKSLSILRFLIYLKNNVSNYDNHN
jgi:hypothetical protein